MIGKWCHVMNEEHFMTGEVVGVHCGCAVEVRQVDITGLDREAQPPSTYLLPLADFFNDGSRLFETEQQLRDWYDWVYKRLETQKEKVARGGHLEAVH